MGFGPGGEDADKVRQYPEEPGVCYEGYVAGAAYKVVEEINDENIDEDDDKERYHFSMSLV